MAAAAKPASGAAPQFASLYVGDLNPDVTEAMLYEIFNAVGPVGSIRVCRDRETRKSLGYAYINFHNVSDAERALDTLNYSSIKGRSCRLMWSQRDSSVRASGVGNVYIKNLDPNIDNKALFDTFSLFGNILSCKVASYPDGKSKGYGFVQFETEESAKEAIDRVHGVKVGELVVEVHEHQKRVDEEKDAAAFKNLYVKSFPKEWDDEKLKELFKPYGELGAVAVRADWKERPFAFVDFVDPPDAAKAVEELHLKEMRTPEEVEADKESGKTMEKDQDGHPLHLLFVGKMQSKAERQAEWKKDSDQGGGKPGKGGYGKKGGGSGWAHAGGKGGKKGKDGKGPGMGYPGMGGMGYPGGPSMAGGGMPAGMMMPQMMAQMGIKGKPMVSNPQQMMAMMSMMGKGPMGKGPMGMPGMGMGMPPPGKGMGGMPQQGRPPQSFSDEAPLSAAALAAMPMPVQKQMIGEKLFRAVARYQPDLAAKITGMMLEMDNGELLMLLESQSRLQRQIDQALTVLKD